MKLSNFKVLTFDCYGTLIDWETGILNELKPLFGEFVKEDDALLGEFANPDDALLQVFAELETREQQTHPDLLYPDILRKIIVKLAARWRVDLQESQIKQFSQSVANWPAFPDSAQALLYLKKHYKLIILSNIDHHSFSASEKKLQVEFDKIITAQDVTAYKPALNHFHALEDYLQTHNLQMQDVLHTAQSLYHDHIPAKQLGYKTCWINRRYNKVGYGATKAPDVKVSPDFTFNSLADFVEQHKKDE